ncbi:MAG: hypothetical protein M1132_06540 [Chloroflexi bacterium]|nr:hypothetical protein [Chloroflexota bacterium]
MSCVFLARHADGQTPQQQGRTDAVLRNDDLGVLAQRVFDHLHLLKNLRVADKVLLGSLVDQAMASALPWAT